MALYYHKSNYLSLTTILTHRGYEKLHSMLIKNEAGVLEFKPTCPVAKLVEQKRYMGEYLRMLEIRAAIEGIDL